MKFLIFCALVVFCLSAISQNMMSNITNLQGNVLRLEDKYNDVDGEAYLYEDFKEGYVVVKGQKIMGVFMRFDMVSGQVEVQREEGTIMELNPTGITELKMNRLRPDVYEKEFKYHQGKWVEVIDKSSILKLNKRRLVEDSQPGFNTAERRKYFADISQYFLVEDQGYIPFSLIKKDVLNVVDHPKMVNQYRKEHRLKWTDEADVVRLIKYDRTL